MSSGATRILAGTAFVLVMIAGKPVSSCPSDYPTVISLQPTSGSVSHREYYNSYRRCKWSFPLSKTMSHVVLIKITSLSLYRRRCVGYLWFTALYFKGLNYFCNKPTNTCIIYSSLPSCDREKTFNFLKNENCTESYWVFNEDMHRYVTFESRSTTWKSFTFDYKYFTCDPYQESTIAHDPTTPDTQNANLSAGVSSGTLAGVIVLFIFLLLGCSAVVVLLYKRLTRMKQGATVPRVQYEIATPLEITSAYASNAEQVNGTHGRQSEFALHGEQRSVGSRQNVTTHEEDADDRGYTYAVDVNNVEDTNVDYNSFTSDESERDRLNAGTGAYATVNKHRAATCG